MKPMAIDLFCGLGGWTDGLLAEGYDVVGFDIERHRYLKRSSSPASGQKNNGGSWFAIGSPGQKQTGQNPDGRNDLRLAVTERGTAVIDLASWEEYPAQLVLQDVLTIHGPQFRNAALIVASPPCQAYSYMAMPWKLAKAKAAAIRADESGQMLADLNALFHACFRIQREACEAAGRYIPLVVENVKGAQPWVGPAKANFGSFYLWGDVAMVGKRVVCGSEFGKYTKPMRAQKFNPDGTAHGQGSWFAIADSKNRGAALKVPGFNFHEFEKTGKPGGSFQTAAVDGVKQHGSGPVWFDTGIATHSSKSSARKAASAQIAKIPLELSRYVARCYRPRIEVAV